MKRVYLLILSVFISQPTFSQTSTSIGVWLDHLPYGVSVDLFEKDEQVYTATRQGLFIYNNIEKTFSRLSKVSGLSDVGLTTLAYNEKHDLLLIGYQNGNIDLLAGEEVTNVPAIRQSGNYSGLKRVNYIHTEDDYAYFCTDFGIVSYNLASGIVDETYIIGPEGEALAVEELSVLNDSMYAATKLGVMAASLDDPLIFFGSWQLVAGSPKPVNTMAVFDGKLMVNRKTGNLKDSVFSYSQGQWDYIEEIDAGDNNDLRSSRGRLMLTNHFAARAYDENFQVSFNSVGAAAGSSTFQPVGAVMDEAENNLFIADAGGGGLYQNFQGLYILNLRPNSPSSTSVQKMTFGNEKLYVASGAISDVWAPLFNNQGFYVLDEFEWSNYPVSAIDDYKDIVAIEVDPDEEGVIYASSYQNGILKLVNNEVVELINSSSTGGSMQGIQGGSEHRVGGFSSDPDANIWFTNSLTDQPLGVLQTDGSVRTFSLGSIANSSTDVKNILYTSNDQVWMQTRSAGIVVSKIEDGVPRASKRLDVSEGSGNLPSNRVLSFAEDLDGELWIGTDEGVAVLYSPQNIFEPNRSYDAQIIVIDEDGDGNGERVLGSEVIQDIEVDGSNKKWFATAGSGVFYTSANGNQQIYNFTTENSPLPSNNILDIEIDDLTGMVYFASDQGIVSFQGTATKGVEVHRDVFAYPNPVEPGYDGPILIRGLVTNAQVKITDIEGNIIFETIAEGGQAVWNGRNFDGRRANTGVYLAYITNDDGSETAVTKILIVN